MSKYLWKEWSQERATRVELEAISLLDLMRPKQSKRMLDFGCGTGRHSMFFAKAGCEVFGFDQSEEAIMLAESSLKKENVTATLRVWDMFNLPLPYPSRYFDAVVVIGVIHHGFLSDIRNIASEIERVTRPSGYILLQEPSYQSMFNSDGSPKVQDIQLLEPGTIISKTGREKGLVRHYLKREELQELFSNYEVLKYHEGTDHYKGHCLIAVKKIKW